MLSLASMERWSIGARDSGDLGGGAMTPSLD